MATLTMWILGHKAILGKILVIVGKLLLSF